MAHEFEDEKVYCTATINDNFADDVVIVVLNKEATFSFKEYTKNLFFLKKFLQVKKDILKLFIL